MSIRHARSARTALLARTALALTVTGGLVTGLGLPAASAVVPAAVPAAAATEAGPTPAGATLLQVAARYLGTPYVYGGTTPAGFDCSGYTGYVFARMGVALPRTANQQMLATRAVPAAAARAGDLVFYTSGGRAYHAAIYAGNGMMYDSPHTGASVSLRPMWAGSVVYTRVFW